MKKLLESNYSNIFVRPFLYIIIAIIFQELAL